MNRTTVWLGALLGCGGISPVAPSRAPLPPAEPAQLPAASTACYTGLSVGAGQRVRTVIRRIVDPAAREIREDVGHDAPPGRAPQRFHVIMAVDRDRFTMTEAGDAFTGAGTLVGQPWQWTAWTSMSRIPAAGIEVESHDQVTPNGLTATKQIRKNGELVATTTDDLTVFDCAGWDSAVAALAIPVLDRATCDRACRNYATLKYWGEADAELATVAPGSREAARAQKAAELGGKLDAGVPACVAQCLSSHNAAQVACLNQATTLEQLGACDTL